MHHTLVLFTRHSTSPLQGASGKVILSDRTRARHGGARSRKLLIVEIAPDDLPGPHSVVKSHHLADGIPTWQKCQTHGKAARRSSPSKAATNRTAVGSSLDFRQARCTDSMPHCRGNRHSKPLLRRDLVHAAKVVVRTVSKW